MDEVRPTTGLVATIEARKWLGDEPPEPSKDYFAMGFITGATANTASILNGAIDATYQLAKKNFEEMCRAYEEYLAAKSEAEEEGNAEWNQRS